MTPPDPADARDARQGEGARPPRVSPFDKIGADRLADEVAALVLRGIIDARSPAADALLDYRSPPSTPRADALATLRAEHEALREENTRLRAVVDALMSLLFSARDEVFRVAAGIDGRPYADLTSLWHRLNAASKTTQCAEYARLRAVAEAVDEALTTPWPAAGDGSNAAIWLRGILTTLRQARAEGAARPPGAPRLPTDADATREG